MLITVYAGACRVISNRLHALLLAAQSGTLPVPLAHMTDNLKITSILADNGLAGLVVNIEESEAANLARIDAVLLARSDILQRLSRARQENARRIEQGFMNIFHLSDRRARRGGGAAAEILP